MGTLILTKGEAKVLRRLARERGITPPEAVRLLIRSANIPPEDRPERKSEADQCAK